jgi:phage gp36-like protein
MAYITNSDIEKRLGTAAYVQLTDDNGDGSADVAVVDEARLGAEGEVNAHLAARFQVPIDLAIHSELAGLLASITLDLVEIRLRGRRPPVPQDVIRKGIAAVDWLRGVAAGTIDLPAAANVAANTARGTVAASIGEKRLLSRQEMNPF